MRYLFDQNLDHSSCGVGFITHKHSKQTHELLEHAHQALCKIPHRGGMSAEGIGDGAGINIDLSVEFYRYLTGDTSLALGEFGVANFFYPKDQTQHNAAETLIKNTLEEYQLPILLWRDVEVDPSVLNEKSAQAQLAIRQVVFAKPTHISSQSDFEWLINEALEDIEYPAFTRAEFEGLYPLSMSSRTQVYKGRLNSWEVIPYFHDLSHQEHKIHTLFFHTRFSTNTAPNPMFAQPFRRMAHNGELNTDRKNRLSEAAIARSHNKNLIFPTGQSDSARLDQTMARRVIEDKLALDEAALAMMPPAWENDDHLTAEARDMLEYFSLYEEKNDGPAALIFGDGTLVGARLDRLGLRPLRSVETEDYLAVMSEAGQIDFPPESVINRGRIEAGGMIVFNHQSGSIEHTDDVLNRLAAERDFSELLHKARITSEDLPEKGLDDLEDHSSLNISARHVAYSMNQESFKFMLDPMLQTGMEKISAMGYGLAPNALTKDEGGMSRYFSQRFAQVTNPPLDSIREADGMTLRVALGRKPNFSEGDSQQLMLESPILQPQQLEQICSQASLRVERLPALFTPDMDDDAANENNIEAALELLCSNVEALARSKYDVIILTDREVSHNQAALPALLAISAANQRLIHQGLRFNSSIIYETGQAASTHDIACLLGFGAAAVCPLTVYHRAQELFSDNAGVAKGLNNFQKAVEKALMKTMGKFGLCTAESYIGGEFFEANFIDTLDPVLKKIFPNIHSPVGGARFADIARSAVEWHQKVYSVQSENEIPLLGLFKERNEGAGHSFGNTAVREYINMTEEEISYVDLPEDTPALAVPDDAGYRELGYEALEPEQIDRFSVTSAYRTFSASLHEEREQRPAALRDVLDLPVDLSDCQSVEAFSEKLERVCLEGNLHVAFQGLTVVDASGEAAWSIRLNDADEARYKALFAALKQRFSGDIEQQSVSDQQLVVSATNAAAELLKKAVAAPGPIALDQVQPAHEITASFASGAMSHGALVAKAHEAVAQGTNIAGAMSNSGEGGENSRRYNSVKASKIKQFASGRFGVWTGYLADPSLEEIEIKIAQGAKPGEGGQLPAPKVNVEIAAARGGTPGVELVSPPPHHDTYSIEDLGQLIHDAKSARVRVIVKLVSSEGVGTIAVGVAKAGADLINIAGNTGGTGAAQVTSLKNTGRAADIGIAEVHQALAENGLREKITLRCSNAHQTGMDVIKSAMLGGDSFEFGTTALMMLKCVMAKNCNLKCPAGLTTNPEVYQGDPRALAQYFINLAHEVRELLAGLGFKSLREIRGRTDLLHLIRHPGMVGQLDMTAMLRPVDEVIVDKPVYLEANFDPDDAFIEQAYQNFFQSELEQLTIQGPSLNNCNKSTGAQFSIDVERHLNYGLSDSQRHLHPSVDTLSNGRVVLRDGSLQVHTSNSAGQSYAAFNNSGVTMIHSGTCNDGVGKGSSGGRIVVLNPGGGADADEGNVLVGNFALFGATGGELLVQGQAGDRFGVRNSGAVAVVEGVGDFCCEYMTNGSVVNLGSYGKGFANGMSGGTAYQYDPEGAIRHRCSQDSVVVTALTEESDLMAGQEAALRYHLETHLEHTQSALVQSLLDSWQESRQHFYVLIPRSLYKQHSVEEILSSVERKTMLEELSQAWGNWHLQRIRQGYEEYSQNQGFMFDGQVPGYGDCDTDLIYQYVNAAGVLRRALETAEKMDLVKQHVVTADEAARHLIQTEDRKLMETLFKDLKEALAGFDEDTLAVMIADKRIRDYKESLMRREVWDTRAWGTSVWIMAQDQANQAALAEQASLEELLASHYCHVLAQVMREAA